MRESAQRDERGSTKTKVDLGVVPQTLNNSNTTGNYYEAKDYRRALALLQVGALAATRDGVAAPR